MTESTGSDVNPCRYGGQFGYYAPFASNFYLCGLRWYDGDTGRFLSRDPIGYEGGDNLYAYCGGDPVDMADPSGLAPANPNDPNDPANVPGIDNAGGRSSCPGMHRGTPQSKAANSMLDDFMGVLKWSGIAALTAGIGNLFEAGGVAEETTAARGSWKLTNEGAERVMTHSRFGKFYKARNANEWWTVKNAGHGGSAFKVYRQEGRYLRWICDADKYGDYIIGKHKGPTGISIPLSGFNR